MRNWAKKWLEVYWTEGNVFCIKVIPWEENNPLADEYFKNKAKKIIGFFI